MHVQAEMDTGNLDPRPRISAPTKPTLFLTAILFAVCSASAFISYEPYIFQWDDSDYFARSIGVSLAVWSGNSREVGAWMISHHPPAMTLMGVPWGPLVSWPSAGDCFVTLATIIALLVSLSLYLLLRIGVNPLPVIAASVCVGFALGPFPPASPAHVAATAFMADGLFAWTALAAGLLVPYESRVPCSSARVGILRGVLWGLVFSLGTMTKLSFLYFVVTILPLLFFVRLYRDGLRDALTALAASVCVSSPFALYLALWGRHSWSLATTSSFGGVAGFYYTPLPQFILGVLRESPGIAVSVGGIFLALAYLLITRPFVPSWPDLLSILIMLGYGIIVLASPNREFQFSFPVIIALPFQFAILLSRMGHPVSKRGAIVTLGLVFFGLFAAALPTRHRPDWHSFSRCNAVLDEAARWNAGNIVLATDSPTLNGQLMMVAGLYSSKPANIYSLAYTAMGRSPLEQDFRLLNSADLVVFQDRRALYPPFTNQRVGDYERYVQRVGLGPIKITDDTSVYLLRRHQSD